MSFDEILDLTADVFFYFILRVKCIRQQLHIESWCSDYSYFYQDIVQVHFESRCDLATTAAGLHNYISSRVMHVLLLLLLVLC